MGFAAGGQPLAVAGTVAGQHAVEFVPVDLAVAPMFVGKMQVGIGERQSQMQALRYGRIDEFLS